MKQDRINKMAIRVARQMGDLPKNEILGHTRSQLDNWTNYSDTEIDIAIEYLRGKWNKTLSAANAVKIKSLLYRLQARKFDESKHKRDNDGKFSTQGGGSSKKKGLKFKNEDPKKPKNWAKRVEKEFEGAEERDYSKAIIKVLKDELKDTDMEIEFTGKYIVGSYRTTFGEKKHRRVINDSAKFKLYKPKRPHSSIVVKATDAEIEKGMQKIYDFDEEVKKLVKNQRRMDEKREKNQKERLNEQIRERITKEKKFWAGALEQARKKREEAKTMKELTLAEGDIKMAEENLEGYKKKEEGLSASQAYALAKVFQSMKAMHAVETIQKEGKMYVKTFLIDDSRNNNGWRATWGSIIKNAKSFIGRPGIEYTKCTEHGCRLDHTEGDSHKDSLHKQEPYRVTTIRDVILDNATHTAYAIHEVLNDDFAEKIKLKRIKYLSPSIWPSKEHTTMAMGDNDEWYIDTTKWKGLHDAWVDQPAYGHDARVVGTCIGDKSCVKALKQNKSLMARVFESLNAREFDESKHTRDDDGKFSSQGGKGKSRGLKFKNKDLSKSGKRKSIHLSKPKDGIFKVNQDFTKEFTKQLKKKFKGKAIPKGGKYSHAWLTDDGKWIEGDNHESHEDMAQSIIGEMDKEGTEVYGKNGKKVDYQQMASPLIIAHTQNIRIQFGSKKELNAEIYHPVTSAQRRALKDYAISHNLDHDSVRMVMRGEMGRMREELFVRGLVGKVSPSFMYRLILMARAFDESKHKRDNDGKFSTQGGGGKSMGLKFKNEDVKRQTDEKTIARLQKIADAAEADYKSKPYPIGSHEPLFMRDAVIDYVREQTEGLKGITVVENKKWIRNTLFVKMNAYAKGIDGKKEIDVGTDDSKLAKRITKVIEWAREFSNKQREFAEEKKQEEEANLTYTNSKEYRTRMVDKKIEDLKGELQRLEQEKAAILDDGKSLSAVKTYKLILLARAFDESKHKRDNDGKFSTQGGGGTGKAPSAHPRDDTGAFDRPSRRGLKFKNQDPTRRLRKGAPPSKPTKNLLPRAHTGKAYSDKIGEITKAVEENKHRMGYSYNPATNNLYDITEEGSVNKLRGELIGPNGFDPKKRIYITSVSNHQGGVGRRLRSSYGEAATRSQTPLIGGWASTEVKDLYYTDGSFPFQADSVEEAKAIGKHYQQETITVLEADGGYDFI